eukprot:3831073-Prymnesium_polylepis.1
MPLARFLFHAHRDGRRRATRQRRQHADQASPAVPHLQPPWPGVLLARCSSIGAMPGSLP